MAWLVGGWRGGGEVVVGLCRLVVDVCEVLGGSCGVLEGILLVIGLLTETVDVEK